MRRDHLQRIHYDRLQDQRTRLHIQISSRNHDFVPVYKHKNVPFEQGMLVPGYKAPKRLFCQVDCLDSRATVTFVRKTVSSRDNLQKSLKKLGENRFHRCSFVPGYKQGTRGYVPGYKIENVPPKQGTFVPGYKPGNAFIYWGCRMTS